MFVKPVTKAHCPKLLTETFAKRARLPKIFAYIFTRKDILAEANKLENQNPNFRWQEMWDKLNKHNCLNLSKEFEKSLCDWD